LYQGQIPKNLYSTQGQKAAAAWARPRGLRRRPEIDPILFTGGVAISSPG